MAAAKPAAADLSRIRNIGVIAHIDAGKTTTTEHILFYSQAKHKLGAVDSGNTETDFDQEEQERGITIYSACIPFQWTGHTVNLIDTPGHVDFTAEVERSLRVLDGAVVVFDAQKGVEAQSETVWRQANKYEVPRLVFINKMDIVGANFAKALESTVKRLGANPVAVAIPVGAGSPKDSDAPFSGTIDLIEMKALEFSRDDQGRTVTRSDIPGHLLAGAQEWRARMLDALTAHDDKDLITSAVLEEREVPIDALRKLIRELTLARKIQPVLPGSGREHIGVQPLLDAVVHYLPSPLDRPPVTGTDPKKNKETSRKPDPKEPFCGLVFKYVHFSTGPLYFVRIYSGSLKANTRMVNPGRGNFKEMITKLYHTLADPSQRKELAEASAGDIVAIIGMRESITGDTLCDAANPIQLPGIGFAHGVLSQTIEPESSADKKELVEALDILKKEDPTFSWGVDKDSGQTLMRGMGTLHLEVRKNRLLRDFKLKVRIGKPRVSYRETVKGRATVEGECVRSLPGAGGMFAKVTVELEPIKGDSGIQVFNQIDPEAIPYEWSAAAEEGVRAELDSGDLGYPLMGVRAVLVSAEKDDALSSPEAFRAAGAEAVRKAKRGNTLLLEPWMKLVVEVPEQFSGALLGDINARRGEVQNFSHHESGVAEIVAIAPMGNLFDYADKSRSLSQGRASHSMEPAEYKPASADVLAQLLGG
ncbi:MAG: elongation factor G [Gemmataceae bacterium]|nr:elongation factor G [Gemmataceae bacterium]